MEIDRQKKAELLHRAVKHIDITAHDPRRLIDAYKEMSFSARELGRACEIYERMLEDADCTIILTVAGSTSAAGCMQIYVDLLRHNMVDIVVATGATVVDMDFFEALGFSHYRGTQFVDDGGLVSYGVSYPDLYYRAAGYVDRIFKGAAPAELAIERPAKFAFAINRATARALGLVIPPDLLLRADWAIG